MTATVIRLPVAAKSARKPRRRKQFDVVEVAHREHAKVGSGATDLSRSPTLSMLAWAAKVAPPRARSVAWRGVRFPLVDTLWGRIVVCPRTGRRMVGTVTL